MFDRNIASRFRVAGEALASVRAWGRPWVSGKLAAMQETDGQPQGQPSPQGESEGPPAMKVVPAAREIGGPRGPEPTRYGDWEKAGRCIDF